jgi:hypothetical protein
LADSRKEMGEERCVRVDEEVDAQAAFAPLVAGLPLLIKSNPFAFPHPFHIHTFLADNHALPCPKKPRPRGMFKFLFIIKPYQKSQKSCLLWYI